MDKTSSLKRHDPIPTFPNLNFSESNYLNNNFLGESIEGHQSVSSGISSPKYIIPAPQKTEHDQISDLLGQVKDELALSKPLNSNNQLPVVSNDALTNRFNSLCKPTVGIPPKTDNELHASLNKLQKRDSNYRHHMEFDSTKLSSSKQVQLIIEQAYAQVALEKLEKPHQTNKESSSNNSSSELSSSLSSDSLSETTSSSD